MAVFHEVSICAQAISIVLSYCSIAELKYAVTHSAAAGSPGTSARTANFAKCVQEIFANDMCALGCCLEAIDCLLRTIVILEMEAARRRT